MTGHQGMTEFERRSIKIARNSLIAAVGSVVVAALAFFVAAAGAYFAYETTQAARESVKAANDQIRRDERPSVDIIFKPISFKVNQPLSGTVEFINNGKTPARMVYADMFIEKVRNGEQPKMAFMGPHSQLFTGTVFPNREPAVGDINRSRFAKDGKTFEHDPLTEIEWEEFQQNKIFFVTFAKVIYTDFFNVQHWTQKCDTHVLKKTLETLRTITTTSQSCASYADIDDH